MGKGLDSVSSEDVQDRITEWVCPGLCPLIKQSGMPLSTQRPKSYQMWPSMRQRWTAMESTAAVNGRTVGDFQGLLEWHDRKGSAGMGMHSKRGMQALDGI